MRRRSKIELAYSEYPIWHPLYNPFGKPVYQTSRGTAVAGYDASAWNDVMRQEHALGSDCYLANARTAGYRWAKYNASERAVRMATIGR